MEIAKSLGENLQTIIGNGLVIFIDDLDNVVKLKDTEGIIKPLGDYYNASATYQGSFFSTLTQTTLGSEIKKMTLSNTDISNGVVLQNGTQIKVTGGAGVYNLQFSAQIRKTQGGSSEQINIWFRKNNQDIPNSNTALTLANNNVLIVASWNFFAQMSVNDYLEVMWYSTDTHIQLVASSSTANYPAIPSVIVTMNKV